MTQAGHLDKSLEGLEKMATRKRYSHDFKRQVVEEFERGILTAQALGRKHNVHPISIYQWAKKLREGALIDRPSRKEKELEKKLAAAERKIGQQAIAIDLLKKLQVESSQSQRRFASFRERLSVAVTAPESVVK
jgi:transposase